MVAVGHADRAGAEAGGDCGLLVREEDAVADVATAFDRAQGRRAVEAAVDALARVTTEGTGRGAAVALPVLVEQRVSGGGIRHRGGCGSASTPHDTLRCMEDGQDAGSKEMRPQDGVTLLCVGDLHIGRAPTRIADAALQGTGIDRRDLSPAAAWGRIVNAALERGVDALVLLGDVVDEDNALLEAVGPFGQGVRRLAEAGIEVVAVAGNHDVEALPKLVDTTEGITLLGRAGVWQSRVVRGAGDGAVRLVGWSFAQRSHVGSPLVTMPEAWLAGAWGDQAGELPTIGLLHCDHDVVGSRHAPVRRAELDAVPVDAWLLGHIHKPDAMAGPRPIGYLGSVVPLDPGEAGTHGAWIAHCDAAGVRLERLPVARHRYERAVLDIGRVDEPADVVPMLHEVARETHRRVAAELADERVLVARLELVGEHPRHGEIVEELLGAGELGDSWDDIDGVLHLWEPRVHDHARTQLDVDALAASRDLAAPLARLAVEANAPDPAPMDPELLQRLREHLQREVLGKAPFREGELATLDLGDVALTRLVTDALPDALAAIEANRGEVLRVDRAGVEVTP